MINPDLLDLDLEVSDGISNAPVASVTVDNLLLQSQKFCELCSQLNEGQQHLFNFVMQHAAYCKLAEKNNEMEPKPSQIFFSGGAGVGKFFSHRNNRILKKKFSDIQVRTLIIHLFLLLHLLGKLLLMSLVLHCILHLTSLLNQD